MMGLMMVIFLRGGSQRKMKEKTALATKMMSEFFAITFATLASCIAVSVSVFPSLCMLNEMETFDNNLILNYLKHGIIIPSTH